MLLEARTGKGGDDENGDFSNGKSNLSDGGEKWQPDSTSGSFASHEDRNSPQPSTHLQDPIKITFDHTFCLKDMLFETAHSDKFPIEMTSQPPSLSDGFSHNSAEDIEKEGIAPILVQPGIEVQKIEGSNPKYAFIGDHKSLASPLKPWRISLPPRDIASLPLKRGYGFWRRLRHKLLSTYQRLFALVLIGNIVAFLIEVSMKRPSEPFGPSLGNMATATAANILGGILIRQETVINGLYRIFCWTPTWMPLRIRRSVARLYHFGGVHSGCGVSATIWFMLFTALVTKQQVDGYFDEPAVIAITYILLTLLLMICLFAVPMFRIFSHNTFEAVHRFAGWLAITLFWVQLLLVLQAQSRTPGSGSFGQVVVKAPAFWLLLAITWFIILPWLRLRRVAAYPEVLSNHAVRVHFKYTKIDSVKTLRITHHPLKEWHPFACIPAADGSSFSMIVSDAGDWTKKQIIEPSTSYWVKGLPTQGLLRMATIFKKVVFITTGSGIGPILSVLMSHPMPSRILWSAPNPLETYGENIMQAVANADPNAIILNTRNTGRPDLVALTYHLYLAAQAEAVFVISNTQLTRKVVYGMQSIGVPAYGPIWDS